MRKKILRNKEKGLKKENKKKKKIKNNNKQTKKKQKKKNNEKDMTHIKLIRSLVQCLLKL